MKQADFVWKMRVTGREKKEKDKDEERDKYHKTDVLNQTDKQTQTLRDDRRCCGQKYKKGETNRGSKQTGKEKDVVLYDTAKFGIILRRNQQPLYEKEHTSGQKDTCQKR